MSVIQNVDNSNSNGVKTNNSPELLSDDNEDLKNDLNKELKENNDDDYDYSEFSVSLFEISLTFVSTLLRMGSIILNITLAIEYFNKGKFNYFAWTIACIIIPMFVTTMICVTMYINDSNNLKEKRKYGVLGFMWFVIVMPFLFRYCQSLVYAIESKSAEKRKDKENQKKFFECMIQEESDVALVRIFECFLEAAPQKVLQISIILSGEDKITWLQFIAIAGCLGSMTWSIVVYHKYSRFSQPDKEKISICGMIIQCLWHFCTAVSRILSISIIASLYPLWTLYGCCIHAFFLGLIVFFLDNPTFCSGNLFSSYTFSLTLGFVYVFTYITPRDGPTRYRFSLYYFLCIIENIFCLSLYIYNANDIIKSSNYFIPLCILSVVPYFIGILSMIIYYTKFHPNILARNLQVNS